MTSRKQPPAGPAAPRDMRSSQGGQPHDMPSSPARPPVRPEPAFAPQRHLTARDRSRLAGAFPQDISPAPLLDLACKGTIGASQDQAARNLATLSAALALLAHSPTGCDLVRQLAAAGYSVVFDDARTAARGASGLCEPASKTIVLKSMNDRDTLALLLAHEAVHALQNARAEDMLPSARHRPETVFRLAFAIEADAYAQQVQVAFELSRNQVAQRPLLLTRARFPGLVRAGDRILQDVAAQNHDQGRSAIADGRLMAGLFSAFYDDFALRSYYERVHLDFITSFAAARKNKSSAGAADEEPTARAAFERAAGGLGDFFRRDMTGQRLKSLLVWRGQAYLAHHRPDLDFSAPRFSGLSAPTRAAVEDFYKTFLSGRKMPALTTFGLYVASSARAPEDDKAVPPAVIKPGMNGNGTGSSIRAPRKRRRDFW